MILKQINLTAEQIKEFSFRIGLSISEAKAIILSRVIMNSIEKCQTPGVLDLDRIGEDPLFRMDLAPTDQSKIRLH